MPNQTEPDRLHALESRVAELESFAAALDANGVGGPELQRALREVDRGKVRERKSPGQIADREPPRTEPLPYHAEKLVGGGEHKFRDGTIASINECGTIEFCGRPTKVLSVALTDGRRVQIIDETRMEAGDVTTASERLRPYVAK